jgi:hypothetical protein
MVVRVVDRPPRWSPSTICCPSTTPPPRLPSRCRSSGWSPSSPWSPCRSARSSGHRTRGLRAAESLATSVPLFLLLFAATYVVLAALSTRNFGEHLSHTDGLYFTVTVFSTVGFDDITAKTETTRLMVTAQMIADLIVLGLAIRVIVGAVRRGQQRQGTADEQAQVASKPGR